MRKQLKNKRRSCSMCKPHKTGQSNRWKPKEREDRKLAENEKKSEESPYWEEWEKKVLDKL
jgi:hypothetical protein